MNTFLPLYVIKWMRSLLSGNSLQCYNCQTQDGQLYTSDECIQYQVIENCTDGNFTCVNYRRNKTTENNETIELQEKGCLLKEKCSSLQARCDETTKNGGECESLCCDDYLCNDDFDEDPVPECYHCDGPFPNGSLGLSSFSFLNQSYGSDECNRDLTTVPCPYGKCSKFSRRFKNENNIDIVVQIRSCLSSSKCNETAHFCRKEYKERNDTICDVRCCDYRSFCNAAPRRDLMPFFIALIGFIACQL